MKPTDRDLKAMSALLLLQEVGLVRSVWRRGMRALASEDGPRRISWEIPGCGYFGGLCDGDWRTKPRKTNNCAIHHDAAPDTSEDLTVQGLLLLAREARRSAGAREPVIVYDPEDNVWRACVYDHELGLLDAIGGDPVAGVTEADCIVEFLVTCARISVREAL